MVVMQLRQSAVSAFDCGGRTLESFGAFKGPSLPSVEGIRWRFLSGDMSVKAQLSGRERFKKLGFAFGAASPRDLPCPIN